jgi:tRNA (guanine37-N1)-methyltransferase
MRIDILTLFPEYFAGPLTTSILKRAAAKRKVVFKVHDIRRWTNDRRNTADDVPYGGGAGMVMKPEPLTRAVKAVKGRRKAKVIYTSPQGRVLTHALAAELAREKALIVVCGHYEGVDERFLAKCVDLEVSIGDYVLTGGEPAAAVLSDAVVRLIPGVVGDSRSVERDSFCDGLLDHPHYTRPRVFERMEVPAVLMSGNHRDIEEYRRREALRATLNKRPDLLERAELTPRDREVLEELRKEKS